MEKIADSTIHTPFNGPLETGIRAVVLLYTCLPQSLDIQRLTAMDYLLVHTSILDGPEDLHPKTPIMTPVTQVRRKTVQEALNLMMSRDLISQSATKSGIVFHAGESAALFFHSLQTIYLQQLISRAEWLNDYFAKYDDCEFNELMKSLLSNWVSEFHEQDHYYGSIQ